MNKLIIKRSPSCQLLEYPTGDLHPCGLHAHIRLHQVWHNLLYGLQILCIIYELARVFVNDSNHIVGDARNQEPHFFAPIRLIVEDWGHQVAVQLCQLLRVGDEKCENLERVAHHIWDVPFHYHSQRGDQQWLHCIEGRGPFQVSQSECCRLKKDVQIVGTSGGFIQCCWINKRRKNLPQNVCELQDLTLCQLHCAIEGTHGIEIFTFVQQLTQPLEKLL